MKSLFALIVLLIASSAANASPYYSTVASGCIIDADSVANGRAVQYSGDGSVHFASGKTGTIQLTCPVSYFACTSTSQTVSVTAQNGFSSGGIDYSYVRAVFNRTPQGAGSGATIYTTSNYTSSARGNVGGVVAHTFSFGSYYYWVVIEMTRTSTAYDTVAWGASISC